MYWVLTQCSVLLPPAGKVGLISFSDWPQSAAETPLWRCHTFGALGDSRSPGGSGTYENRSALIDGLKYNQGFPLRAVIHIFKEEITLCVNAPGVYSAVIYMLQLLNTNTVSTASCITCSFQRWRGHVNMSCNLLMQGCGSHMKPNDLVSCHRDGLIDRPFSPTAASQTPAAEAQIMALLDWNKKCPGIFLQRREFRGY